MKKQLLLALALLPGALTANAAMDMYMGEQKLANNGTYTFNTIEEDPIMGGFIIDPHLSLQSTEETVVNIEAKCTSGQEIQMCAGGQCEKAPTVRKEDITLQANEKLNLQFEYIDNEAEDKAQLPKNITTVFTIEGDEELSYTIVMNSDGSGIAAVVERDRNVAYTDGELIYNLSKPGNLILCDTNGRVIINTTLSGNGSFSLAGIDKGIYIYRLGNNAGKIVVR